MVGKGPRWLTQLLRMCALAVLFASALVVGVSTPALADDGVLDVVGTKADAEGVVVGEGEDNDELFASYVEQRIEETLPDADEQLSAQDAYEQLTGNELNAYNALKGLIKKVAAGELSSTAFVVPASTVYGKEYWTKEDLGLDSLEDRTAVEKAAFGAISDVAMGKVLTALLSDMPYELYWHNKTQTTRVSYNGYNGSTDGFGYTCDPDENKVFITGNLYFLFPVVDGYAPTNATHVEFEGQSMTYDFNTGCIERVNKALQKAREIVDAGAGKTYYNTLDGYRQAICDLVSYDSEAMAVQDPYYYGDPWQMINVFDGDTTTNVACEGYAKAFKYLCDMTNFNGDVKCLLVNGPMGGGTGAGAHTWNVVRMDDGRNYLVDITNCDTDTIGYPNLLFLAPKSSGTVKTSYTFACGDKGTVNYTYGDDTRLVFTESDLVISPVEYGRNILTIADQTYTGEPIELSINLVIGGTALTQDTDFSDSYKNNVNAGTALLTLTFINNYKDEDPLVQSFTILPADIANATVAAVASQYHTGSAVEPKLALTFNGKSLVADTDYTVTYENNVEVGTATATITGKGNFKGTNTASFEIVPAPENPFIDVKETTAHYKDILWLSSNKISEGWTLEDGTREFRPYVNVARADMAAFLFRLAVRWGVVGEDWQPSGAKSFTDVTAKTSHYREIMWLAETGISEGWDAEGGGKEFRPLANVARADMAAFLFRLAVRWGVVSDGWQPSGAKSFTDVTAKTAHYREVMWLAETGISEGWGAVGGKEFRPYASVARADMAAFLHRMDGVK